MVDKEMDILKAKIQEILMNSSEKSAIGWAVEEDDFRSVAGKIYQEILEFAKREKIMAEGNSEQVLQIKLTTAINCMVILHRVISFK